MKLSYELKTFLTRLKECDAEEISKNPALMIKLYPIQDPDNDATIFDEIYRLLGESILLKSYKWKLFHFLNIILSSTKVPAYVIAAYIKKLSRRSLNAKPRTVLAILKLVGNLFIRHPILIHLRDNVDIKARQLETDQGSNLCMLRTWLEKDLFDDEQVIDLKATNAMDSCIWELMPLRFHCHPRIASAASFLGESKLPEMEFDLNDTPM